MPVEYAIRWTIKAQQNLEEIYDYVALDSVSAADLIVGQIFEKIRVPQTFPNVGSPVVDMDVNDRFLIATPYNVY